MASRRGNCPAGVYITSAYSEAYSSWAVALGAAEVTMASYINVHWYYSWYQYSEVGDQAWMGTMMTAPLEASVM